MRIINLTPHSLNIKTANGRMIQIPPSGQVARVNNVRKRRFSVVLDSGDALHVQGIDPTIDGLPEKPIDNTIFVVSSRVARLVDRLDVMSPGQLIRDKDGRVVGCRGLTFREVQR